MGKTEGSTLEKRQAEVGMSPEAVRAGRWAGRRAGCGSLERNGGGTEQDAASKPWKDAQLC